MNHSLQLYRPRSFTGVKPKVAQPHNHFHYGLRLINRILVGQAWLLMLAFLLLFVKAILAIIELYPLTYLIDYLTGYRPDLVSLLNLPALASPLIMTGVALTTALVSFTLLHSLADTLADVCLTRCGNILSYKLRFRIFAHLNQFPHTPHHQRQVDEVLTRFIRDVNHLEDFLITASACLVGNFFLLAGTLLFLAYYQWEMALLGLVIIGATALLSRHFMRYIQTTFQQQRAYEDDLAAATQELLTPILPSQPYDYLNNKQEQFAEYNHKNFKATRRTATLQAQFGGLSKIVEALSIVILLWFGLWLFNQTNISIGSVLLLSVLSYNLIRPTRKFIEGWVAMRQARTSVERIGELLNQDIDFVSPPLLNPVRAKASLPMQDFLETPLEKSTKALLEDGAASLEEVTERSHFLPTGSDIAHLNLAVQPGEVLALLNVPQTDTAMITELLVNLTATPDGKLWIGRQANGDFAQATLPQFHIMLREPVLFNGSVADNIAQGNTEVTREQIVKAAQQANAHRFIETWPTGYDTLLGEGGETLSTDQRQCIAIARAILQDAPVLVLDEPTLLLDAAVAEWVRAALRILMQGRTTLMLSHDPALLSLANRIVRLREGQVESVEVAQTLTQALPENKPPTRQPAGEEQVEIQAIQPIPATLFLAHSPVFQQKFPALGAAIEAETMRRHVQTILIGAARSQQYTIERCTPGRVTYTNAACILPYELEILDRASGKKLTHWVLGHLFADLYAAENYLRRHLAPLTAQIVGHPENLIFAKPCTLLDGLNLVLHVFPIDGELPMLMTLTHGEQMIEFFQNTLPEAAQRRFDIQECTISVLQYEPHQMGLMRYQLDGRLAGVNKAGREVLFGQVTADENGELIAPAILGLRRWMQENNRVYRFNLPQLLSHHPDVHLTLFETIPGTPLIPQLLKAHLAGAAQGHTELLTLENALDASARIASTLHTAGIPLGQTHTAEDEFAALEKQLQPVGEFSPALAQRLQSGLKKIQAYANKSEPLPLCFSHGAFTPLKPLFERAASGLLDLGNVCQAESARDLGHFQAHLRLLMLEAQPTPTSIQADQLCAQFLQTYMVELGYTLHRAEHLHIRVQIYEATQLIQSALHHWQHFATAQLEQLLIVLEERLAALPQIQHQETVRKPSLYWLNSHARR